MTKKGCVDTLNGVILFYSFGGSTKKYAQRLAENSGFKAYEIKEAKHRSIFGAFMNGCSCARRQRPSAIAPVDIDWNGVDKAVIASPVWAGFPAPAFNAMLELVPKGTPIAVALVSGGGSTSKSRAKTEKLIAEKGLMLESYEDVLTKRIYQG